MTGMPWVLADKLDFLHLCLRDITDVSSDLHFVAICTYMHTLCNAYIHNQLESISYTGSFVQVCKYTRVYTYLYV